MTGVPIFWGLTRFNLRHLLLSPVFLVGMPLTLLFLGATSYIPNMPTANDLHHQSASSAMGIAAIMFVITSFPALREVRYSADLALPLSAHTRLLSLALAAVALTSVCTGLLVVLYLLRASAPVVGVMSPYTLVSVFLTSWFGPLAAVAAAAWVRSFAPLVLFSMLIPAYVLYSFTAMGSRADVLISRMSWIVSTAMLPFPIGNPGVTVLGLLYLVYAVLLAAAIMSAAMVRKAPGRGLRPVPLGVSLLLVAMTMATVVHGNRTYTYETNFSVGQLHGVETASCRVRDGVAYCPLPGYESWVDYWHAALAPTLERVPERERHRLGAVWQVGNNVRHDLGADPPERSIVVGEYWDTEHIYSSEELAGDGASLVVGLPLIHADAFPCSGSGQSRLLVGAWLASADEELTREERIRTADSMLLRFDSGPEDLALAHALIDLPGDRVGAVVDEHWDTLTAPETGTGELADLLDLPEPGTSGFPEPDWEASIWTEEELEGWWEWASPACA
ncbi:hypothetical protein [Nocardiopsis ganjiahuensis]|uniref:hypothetical protein n=1 Tax=Nocardiopsis ganjiahuensis TaxID=239984 RepID=UPI000348788D|nr:hypothetical protein [Nocardiopsis ganjiahuensis]